MDRMSVVLFIGIALMLTICGNVIYYTWISDEGIMSEGDVLISAGGPPKNDSNNENQPLLFNDDTSITNNSKDKLWVRARIAQPQGNAQARESFDSGSNFDLQGELNEQTAYDSPYQISSCRINDNWQAGEDGWYYYSKPLWHSRTTAPFAEEVRYGDDTLEGCFSLDVEVSECRWAEL